MSDAPTNAPAIQQPKKPETLKDFLSLPAYKGRFEEILGKRAAQFMASITNYASLSKQVAECEPRSVIASAFIAATLDLPIDKNLGFAWIVPYAGKAQFQMGFRGYVQLALRSGQYQAFNARIINAEAFVGYDKAVGDPIIAWDKVDEDKPAVGYAVAWRLTNGFVKTAFWSVEKVTAHASRYSQAFKKKRNDSPWTTHFDKMALKTVIANELKAWGILSIELQTAIEHDQGSQEDIGSPVKHDDGTLAVFDNTAGESMSDVLGDGEKKTEAPPTEEKPAYTEKEYLALVVEVENLALNTSQSETRLIAVATKNAWSVPAKAAKLSALPFATLQLLKTHCQAVARGDS